MTDGGSEPGRSPGADRESAPGDEIRLRATDEAESLLGELASVHGDVAVLLDDGCCDGMGPQVVEASVVAAGDVRIGSVGGVDVLVPSHREGSRRGYELAFDVADASGVGSFSLEVPRGIRLTVDERRLDNEK